MLLKEVLNGIDLKLPSLLDLNFEVHSLENDSRVSGPGTLFIASSGFVEDAHPYVKPAFENGCRYFIVSNDRLEELKNEYPSAFFIGTDCITDAIAYAARNYFFDPSAKLCLIGITGTSGKTTTAFVVYSVLTQMGCRCGLIGTIDYRIGEKKIQALNTTPDVLYLNKLLDNMVREGLEYCVMEVSSHALALGRVSGLRFDAVAFTNLSQDHLDFHKSMENYLSAKLLIFDLLSKNGKNKRTAVINADIDVYDKVKACLNNFDNISVRTFSLKGLQCDYPVRIGSMEPSGSEFMLNGSLLRTKMIGITNLYDFSQASILLMETGFPLGKFGPLLNNINVSGRMESIESPRGFSVVIDYAHKPDALEKLLSTVRSILKRGGRVITVFGAGGDRDRTKRPVMGRIAGTLSDRVLITSDNPRSEDPYSIIRGIEEGLRETGNTDYMVEADRSRAIKLALENAMPGDIVVIAGKGHEDYQITGKEKIHFSDREEVEKFLSVNSGDIS